MTDHERLCELLKHLRMTTPYAIDNKLENDYNEMLARLRSDGPDGLRVVPAEPTREMLGVIVYNKFPEDWNEGKIAQMRLGTKVIPPKTEFEIAYGQYRRLLRAGGERD